MANIPDAIYFKDRESRVIQSNQAHATRFSVNDTDGMIGKTDFDLFPEEQARAKYEAEQQIMRTGQPVLNLEEPGSGMSWLLTTKMPLRDEHGDIIGTFGISHDITALKQTQTSLEALNKELQDFAYVVSHDLKAPLRGIAHLSQWLVEDYSAAFDEQGRKMVSLLVGRVKRLDDLIEGILQYSRIGRIDTDEAPVDLQQLVPTVIDSLAVPGHIQISIDSALPIVQANMTRMTQLFQNLIGNAVKFLDKPRGTITINCENHKETWLFRIADNGPGIEARYHEKIFNIFHTLTARDHWESTGIGLTLVKKIVELYGGRVWVESTAGEGSTFLFTLPKTWARSLKTP
jgi:PAS domain S-box-containing protein